MKNLRRVIGLLGVLLLIVSGGSELIYSNPAFAGAPLLIETDEVAKLMGQPGVVIIDARDKAVYEKGHIPGAVNIDKGVFRRKEDLAYKAKNGFLTPPENAEMVFGNAGIDENTRVIVYGSTTFPLGPSLFFLLKQFGHDNVQVMRGEIEKWVMEGRPITTDVPTPKPKVFKARPRPETQATSDWLVENADKVILLDMRTFEEYTGLNKAGNAKGGHIPSAYPVWWREIAGDMTLKSPTEMLEILKKNGVPIDKDKEYVTYCNWGGR